MQDLTALTEAAQTEITQCSNLNELSNLKAKYLGKKSSLTAFYGTLKELPPEERPAFGQALNEAKQKLEAMVQEQEEKIRQRLWNAQSQNQIDLTLPGISSDIGGLHPLTLVMREIEDIFLSMGFEIAEGYDIEDEFHNFDALNTPPDHPSRNLADTFFLRDGNLLRTQTSTVQVRVMEKYAPPIRIISPGRCYRNDKADASHSPVFHQVEGLVVEEGTTLADMKDTLQNFAKLMFGSKVRTRIRPHFFPFTEPSAEMDMSCSICEGKGCRVCKNTGWLELCGAGMVDPAVFDILKIDSEKYTGYAFGLGIDRIAMMKYDIPDLRILYENDLRVLRQFR